MKRVTLLFYRSKRQQGLLVIVMMVPNVFKCKALSGKVPRIIQVYFLNTVAVLLKKWNVVFQLIFIYFCKYWLKGTLIQGEHRKVRNKMLRNNYSPNRHLKEKRTTFENLKLNYFYQLQQRILHYAPKFYFQGCIKRQRKYKLVNKLTFQEVAYYAEQYVFAKDIAFQTIVSLFPFLFFFSSRL